MGEGKLADLIVLDGNPLTDPGLLADGLGRVRPVLMAGRSMRDLPP